MKTLVFLGPSLPLNEAKNIYKSAIFLPPISCGDLIKCLRLQPQRIAIIDGFFHYKAAVWHKEILYALSKGIEVYGASSMGALRAAELYQYGMIGHGKIFEAFKNKQLNDDDEVAVLHLSEKGGYLPKTDAMVNIRFTLELAEDKNIISSEIKNILLDNLKNQYYQKRNLYSSIVDYFNAINHDSSLFISWLNENYIDQKKADAIDLLKHLSMEHKLELKKISINHTSALESLITLS